MLKVIDKVCEIREPDFMTFAEDMSYNNSPMVSKELFDEFMKPYYDIVVPHIKKCGIRETRWRSLGVSPKSGNRRFALISMVF